MQQMPERTPLEKAVDKAFAYHPYKQSAIMAEGGYIIGPTFVVRGDYASPLSEGNSRGLWRDDPFLPLKAQGILAAAGGPVLSVEVDKGGHPMEQISATDKFGAEHVQTPKKCTCRAVRSDGVAVGELGFPLFTLAKKAGASTYTKPEDSPLVFGWDGDNLVVALAMKYLNPLCRPEA